MDNLPAEIVGEQSVAEFCAAQAEAIRVLAKRTAGDILEIGQRLHEVKGRIGHGNFLQWIDDEFGWAERTAQNFMQVATAARKSAKFADMTGISIDPSTLYMLTVPKALPEWQNAVIEAAQSGEHITLEAASPWPAASRPAAASCTGGPSVPAASSTSTAKCPAS